MTLVDEYSREALAIRVARRLGSMQVIETLADAMVVKGVPQFIRSDNGPEMTALEVKRWLQEVGSKTLFIEPGSPWENGYCESFNGKLTFSNLVLVMTLSGRYDGAIAMKTGAP